MVRQHGQVLAVVEVVLAAVATLRLEAVAAASLVVVPAQRQLSTAAGHVLAALRVVAFTQPRMRSGARV
ncbi:MAG: hypothetical protein DME33_00380 [Verrucomicrobia bacterium]|nr:MAG: hypothetical protein DME33_00380 [Verrucomicrobiota bacterium]